MTIETFIKNSAVNLSNKVYVAPDIPDKKLNGAINGIAPDADPDYVLAIADTTVLGGAKEGLLFTGEYLYVHAILSEKHKISLAKMTSIDYHVKEIVKDNGKTEKIASFIINMNDESSIDLSKDLVNIHMSKLHELLTSIIDMAEIPEDFTSTSQTMPLSMMPIEVKKSYIKLICNYCFVDDQIIDAKEYAEIIALLVRIDMNAQDRIEIRSYMTNYKNLVCNERLIEDLKEMVTDTDFEMITKSLIKDFINLARSKDNTLTWKEDAYILKMVKLFELNEDQVDLIEKAIINDEDILNLRKNDSQIKKSMVDITAKAAAVGVPLAAIYFSGSVIGVSAAGITSGLATLGLGGVLGFSSMFTGIGVAVIIGLTTYKGLKKITGISDIENNKQREMMLQAIIRNSQKSLNFLIEDVNEITKRLTDEIKKSLQSQDKIQELTEILGMLSEGAKVTSDKLDYAETEKIITHLPIYLDVTRLEELTDSPTKLKYREVVMSCYNQATITLEDGSIKDVLELDYTLKTEDYVNLENIFDALGYNHIGNASAAAIKGFGKNIANKMKG